MTLKKYFQEFDKKIKETKNSYDEARMLGQDEEADKLADELYETCFNEYLFIKKLRRLAQEIKIKQTDSEVIKRLEKLENIFEFSSEKQAADLDEFCQSVFDE